MLSLSVFVFLSLRNSSFFSRALARESRKGIWCCRVAKTRERTAGNLFSSEMTEENTVTLQYCIYLPSRLN